MENTLDLERYLELYLQCDFNRMLMTLFMFFERHRQLVDHVSEIINEHRPMDFVTRVAMHLWCLQC